MSWTLHVRQRDPLGSGSPLFDSDAAAAASAAAASHSFSQSDKRQTTTSPRTDTGIRHTAAPIWPFFEDEIEVASSVEDGLRSTGDGRARGCTFNTALRVLHALERITDAQLRERVAQTSNAASCASYSRPWAFPRSSYYDRCGAMTLVVSK